MKKDAIKRNVDWIYEPARAVRAERQRNSFGPAQATPPPTWPAAAIVIVAVSVFVSVSALGPDMDQCQRRETGHKLRLSATVAAHSEAKRS